MRKRTYTRLFVNTSSLERYMGLYEVNM